MAASPIRGAAAPACSAFNPDEPLTALGKAYVRLGKNNGIAAAPRGFQRASRAREIRNRLLESVGETALVESFLTLVADADEITGAYLLGQLTKPADFGDTRVQLIEDPDALARSLRSIAATPLDALQENAYLAPDFRGGPPLDAVTERVVLRFLARTNAGVESPLAQRAAKILGRMTSANPAIDEALYDLYQRAPKSLDEHDVVVLAQIELLRLRRLGAGFGALRPLEPHYFEGATSRDDGQTSLLLRETLKIFDLYGLAFAPEFERVIYGCFLRFPKQLSLLAELYSAVAPTAERFRARYPGIGETRH